MVTIDTVTEFALQRKNASTGEFSVFCNKLLSLDHGYVPKHQQDVKTQPFYEI